MTTDPDARHGRTCYLHIGPHKTGTSSIQRVLKKQAVAIGRAGVHLATTAPAGAEPRSSHSHLGSRVNFERARGASLDLAPDWKVLSDDIVSCRGSVVVSGEGLYRRVRDRETYEQIVDFFLQRGFRLVVIASVRDQVGWINSFFAQHLKNFRPPIGFKRYVAEAIETRQFEFDVMLANPLADDRVRLEVVSFEQAARSGLELDFLRRIGVRGVAPRPGEITNPNSGAKAAFVASRIIKARRKQMMRTPGLRNTVDWALRDAAVERGWTKDPFMAFDERGAESVRDHYRPSNDAFSQRVFGAPWEQVAPPRPVSRSVYDPDAASPKERAEVAEVTETLLRMIDEASGAAR